MAGKRCYLLESLLALLVFGSGSKGRALTNTCHHKYIFFIVQPLGENCASFHGSKRMVRQIQSAELAPGAIRKNKWRTFGCFRPRKHVFDNCYV